MTESKDKDKYPYERLKPFEQKIVRDNTERLIYTIIGSNLFDDISDPESLLDEYQNFLDNKINNVPFPQITRFEPPRPKIQFLKNEETEMCMTLIDPSKEFFSEGFLIVGLEEAIESSIEQSFITEESQTKINNFTILTKAYLDSQEEDNQ